MCFLYSQLALSWFIGALYSSSLDNVTSSLWWLAASNILSGMVVWLWKRGLRLFTVKATSSFFGLMITLWYELAGYTETVELLNPQWTQYVLFQEKNPIAFCHWSVWSGVGGAGCMEKQLLKRWKWNFSRKHCYHNQYQMLALLYMSDGIAVCSRPVLGLSSVSVCWM